MATRMQQRRGTAEQWTSANPILAGGEIGFETDTGQFKIGNGSSVWSALSYFKDTTDGATSFAPLVDGLIPLAYMSNLVAGSAANLDTLKELADYADAISGSVETHSNQTTNVHGVADMTALATQTYANSGISTHNSNTTDVHGISNTADLATQTYANSGISTHNSNTTDVHGISNTADLVTATVLASHADDTTGIHGIADTSLLATKAYADNAASGVGTGATNSLNAAIAAEVTNRNTAIETAITDHNGDTTGVHGIVDTSALATKTYADTSSGTAKTGAEATAAAALAAHEADTTNVHGIADTALLALKSEVAAVTPATLGLGNVNNTSDADKPVSTAAQTALDLKAPLASPTFTGTVVLPTVTAGGSIVPSTDNTYDLGSPTKMWKDLYVGPGSLYVNGQKVLHDESGNIVVRADANENLSLRTSGSGNVELDATGTGNIQIKSAMVIEGGSNITSSDGNAIVFGNAINTDSVSSKSTNTDLSLTANGTGKVYINDNAEVNGNLVVGGNLTVSGTTTTVNSETISLADNIIDLNSNFTTGSPSENAGIKIKRGDSSDVQIRWNESSDVWQFTNDGSTYDDIAGKTEQNLKAPLASPTFTGTVTLPAEGIVFSDGTQAKAGVPSITTFASAITSSETLSAGEQDKFVPLAGAVTITLPASGYSTGQSIDFYQASGTGAQFASTNSVVGTPGLKLRTTNSVATAMKTASGWLIFGDLSA